MNEFERFELIVFLALLALTLFGFYLHNIYTIGFGGGGLGAWVMNGVQRRLT